MDPFADFSDLLCLAGPKRPNDLFYDDAIHDVVVSSAMRVVIVYGRVGSGRTHVAGIARLALYAAGCVVVSVETNFENSASTTLTRRGIASACAEMCTLAGRGVVFVTVGRVVRPDATTLHTMAYMNEAALRRRYGIGCERLNRVYQCNIGALHRFREHGVRAQRTDVTTSGVGSSAATLAPSNSALLERVFLWQARRRGKHVYDADAFSYADIVLAAHAELELECPEILLECLTAMVGNAPKSGRSGRSCGSNEPRDEDGGGGGNRQRRRDELDGGRAARCSYKRRDADPEPFLHVHHESDGDDDEAQEEPAYEREHR
jgi:hypothetical protein